MMDKCTKNNNKLDPRLNVKMVTVKWYSARMENAKKRKKRSLLKPQIIKATICLMINMDPMINLDLTLTQVSQILKTQLRIQCTLCNQTWPTLNTKWLILSSILEKCQAWVVIMVTCKNNLSLAHLKVVWEKMAKCIPNNSNLVIRLNAIMDTASKSNAKMVNAKKEILMVLISKTLNKARNQIDLDSTAQMLEWLNNITNNKLQLRDKMKNNHNQ